MSEALAVLCLLLALASHRRAAQADTHVREAADLLRRAEAAWADRHRAAVLDGDAADQLLSFRTMANLMNASTALESRHGHRPGRHAHPHAW